MEKSTVFNLSFSNQLPSEAWRKKFKTECLQFVPSLGYHLHNPENSPFVFRNHLSQSIAILWVRSTLVSTLFNVGVWLFQESGCFDEIRVEPLLDIYSKVMKPFSWSIINNSQGMTTKNEGKITNTWWNKTSWYDSSKNKWSLC